MYVSKKVYQRHTFVHWLFYPTAGIVYGSNYSVTLGAGVSYLFGIGDAAGVFSSATLTYDAIAEGNVTVIGYGAAYSHSWSSAGSSIGMSIGVAGIGISFSANLEIIWCGNMLILGCIDLRGSDLKWTIKWNGT